MCAKTNNFGDINLVQKSVFFDKKYLFVKKIKLNHASAILNCRPKYAFSKKKYKHKIR